VAEGVATEPASGRRPPSMLTVGTVVWLASELMFFGGLFAAYFTLRAESAAWPPRGVELETATSAVATVVLLASSGTIHFASKALERGDRAGVARWLAITLAMGALFLVNQGREFLVNDFKIDSHAYGSIYYLMTGFHGLHVLGGLVMLAIGLVLVTGPGPLPRRGPAVESVTYYWHFVDVVWVGLFTTIFLIK
jgi:cytochrome c oxidase subunit III